MSNHPKYILTFFVVLLCIFFLWFCPPLKGKYYFNILLLISSIILFLYGLIFGDFTLSGLIITTANGLTRLSPNLYPTVSFLCCCLFVGYLLSGKEKNKQIFIENNKTGVVSVVLSFWIINVVSGIVHIIILSKPGIVFIVNRAMMTNLEIIYHIVGYVLFPLSCGVLLFILVINFIDENKEKKFFIFLSIGIIISSIVGILQALGILKGIFGYLLSWEPRVNGLFSDFNSFSISLALLLPIFCYYAFNDKDIYLKILFIIGIILGCINLFLTGTRSGLLLVGVFCILYTVILLLKGKYKTFLVVIGLAILFVAGFKMLSKTNIIRKFYGINRIFTALTTNISLQIQQRKPFWEAGLKVWKENVWFGGGTKSVYKEFSNINPEWIPSDFALNLYIHYLAEIGVVGSIVFFMFLFLIVCSGIKSMKSVDSKKLIYFTLLVALLITMIFHVLELEEVMLLFWIYSGLLMKDLYPLVRIKKFLSSFTIIVCIVFLVGNIVTKYEKFIYVDMFKYVNFAGMYSVEKIDNDNFRWTDKIAIVKFINQQGKKLVLEFNSFGVAEQNVEIFVNDIFKYSVRLPTNMWYKKEIDIVESKSTIKIIPKKTFVAAGKTLRYFFPFSGRDYRTLGVGLKCYLI